MFEPGNIDLNFVLVKFVCRNYADSFVNAAENEDLNEISDTFKEDELIHFGESHRGVVGKGSHVDEVSLVVLLQCKVVFANLFHHFALIRMRMPTAVTTAQVLHTQTTIAARTNMIQSFQPPRVSTTNNPAIVERKSRRNATM